MTFSGKYGGRECVAFSLVELLKEQVNAILYLVIEERTAEEDRAALLKILGEYDASVRLFYTSDVFSRKTLNELVKAVREDHIDIIHSHCNKSILYSILIKKIFKSSIRNTYTLHGLLLPPSLRSMAYYLVNYISLYLTDGLIACSREMSEKLSSMPGLKHVEIIQNSLLAPKVAQDGVVDKATAKHTIASQYGISPGALMIGKVCRLEPQKNVPLYLSAIKRIKDHFGEKGTVVFFLAGDGALRTELEAMAKDLGIEDTLIFAGFVANMKEFYSAMDIIALTSNWEGTPMCLLEAMRHGLPIVTSYVGGIPDMIRPGIEGLVFEDGDESECVKHLISLITDNNLREQLGQNAQLRMDTDLSPHKWAARHTAHYQRLLGVDA